TNDAYWGLRVYCKATDNGSYLTSANSTDAVIQAYVYGDGSNMYVGHGLRMRNDGASVKRYTKQQIHRGWENVCWDVNHQECSIVSGEKTMVEGMWKYDAFWLWKGYVADFEDEDPDFPEIAWEGDIYFDDLKYVHYNNEEQTASLDDIIITGVDDINTGKSVKSVTYYNVAGIERATPFEGGNIVVTKYVDGSKSAVKVIK
ncbi:MAG: hypothetical protein KBT09_09660, partial [Bacteroidales bacterium]|nr:hypothetical protein [Candidatus Sodaliphilus fimicaballi]